MKVLALVFLLSIGSAFAGIECTAFKSSTVESTGFLSSKPTQAARACGECESEGDNCQYSCTTRTYRCERSGLVGISTTQRGSGLTPSAACADACRGTTCLPRTKQLPPRTSISSGEC